MAAENVSPPIRIRKLSLQDDEMVSPFFEKTRSKLIDQPDHSPWLRLGSFLPNGRGGGALTLHDVLIWVYHN